MRATSLDTLREGLRYDGRSGQWAWMLHRLSGLLTVGFISVHVLDSTLVTFFPKLYQKTIRLFKLPLAGLGEIGLIGAVLFHGVNGLRIVVLDGKPEWWRHQKRAIQLMTLLFGVLYLPLALRMLLGILKHTQEETS